MKKSIKFFLTYTFVFVCSVAFAQTSSRQLSGKVTSSDGEPLPGVNIVVKGTTTGTITGLDGTFTMNANVDKNTVLTVSFIGYETQKITIGNHNQFNIHLSEDQKLLDEVVVIGYGTVKKRDLTGAISSVKQEDIVMSPVANPMEALEGRVAGLDITRNSGQSGAAPNVLLRGTRSLTASNSPLYIIDGIQGDITQLNPNDIASVEVLKDASSTAIYGSAGANGVIIVTTKQAPSNKVVVDFNAYTGVNTFASFPSGLTGDAWLNYKKEAYRAANPTAAEPTIADLGLGTAVTNAINSNQWVDWVKETLKTGIQQNYSISIRGGTDKTKAYFSAGYNSEKGIYTLDRTDLYTMRSGVDIQIRKWVKAGVQANLSWRNSDTSNSRLNKSLSTYPLGEPYTSDGSINLYPISGSSTVSPLANYAPNVYFNNNKNLGATANPYIEFTPVTGLSIKSICGFSLSAGRTGSFQNAQSYDEAAQGATDRIGTYNTSLSYGYTWENIATYNKTFQKDHTITVTGITSFNSSQNEGSGLTASGFNYDEFIYYNLGAATTVNSKNTYYSETTKMSYAGRINYSYKDKYLFAVSNRWDGASQLYNKWDYFPSAALAWRISDEGFMEKTRKWLDDLKLRGSYGVSGNSNIPPYVSTTSIGSMTGTNLSLGGGTLLPLTVPSQAVGNTALGWEKSYNYNLGLDASFLNSRVNFTVDCYQTDTKGVLWTRNLPATSGSFIVKTPYQMTSNIAATQNKGVEFTLNSRNIVNKSFQWTSTLTFARNWDKLTSIDLGSNYPVSSLVSANLFVGGPINAIYNYKKLGIWQTSEATEAARYGCIPGQIKIATVEKFDANGVGDGGYHTYSASDKQLLGSSSPKWTFGFQNTFNYQNFDLNVFITMRWGQLVNSAILGAWQYNGDNIPSIFNYWTPTNPSNDYPRPDKSAGNSSVVESCLGIVDGSYMKIKNITLGYSLPKKTGNNLGINKLRVYATITNPLIIAKSPLLKDIDPETCGVGSLGSTDSSDSFPLYRQIVVGVNLTF